MRTSSASVPLYGKRLTNPSCHLKLHCHEPHQCVVFFEADCVTCIPVQPSEVPPAVSRLSPYGEFGSVADDKPNATNRHLTEQLNKFGLAYLHMVEPRIAGNTEVDVTDKTYNLSHFRKLLDGTFIAAGKLAHHQDHGPHNQCTGLCSSAVLLFVFLRFNQASGFFSFGKGLTQHTLLHIVLQQAYCRA